MSPREHRRIDEDPEIICSDIPCLVCLGFVTSGLLAVFICVGALADPMLLRGGLDYHGRVCGVSSHLQNHPFIYWPLPDQLDAGECVKRCPTFEDSLSGSVVPLPRAEALVLQETPDGSRVVFSQAVWLLDVPVYPTVPAVGRFCMPAPATRLIVSPGLTPGNASFASYGSQGGQQARKSMLPALQAELGQLAPQIRRTVGSLWLTRWRLIACAIVAPLLTGALPALLASCCASFVIWFSVIGCCLGAFAIGIAALASDFYASGADDFIVPTLNSLQSTLAQFVGWAFVLWSICILFGACASRHLLQWSAACIQVTAGQLRDAYLSPSVLLVASGVAVAQAAAALLCVWLLEASVSIAAIQWPAELPSASPLLVGGGTSRAPLPSDLEAEVVPGGPLVRGLMRSPVFQFNPLLCIFFAMALLHVTCSLLAAIGRFLVVHIVAHWYFFPPPLSSKAGARWLAHLEGLRAGGAQCMLGPFWDACRSLFSRGLGSVVAGATLPALLPSTALRLLATLLPRCCCPRANHHLGAFAAVLGAAPFVEVAVHGEHFYVGAFQTIEALSNAPPAAQFLGGLPVIFEAATGCLTSLMVFGIFALSFFSQPHGQALGYVETNMGIALLGAFIVHAPAATWAAMYTAAFDTFVLCLARGEQGDLGSASGKHVPQRLSALFSEAAMAALSRKGTGPRTFQSWEAPHGYAAVADSSGSDNDLN